MSLDLLIKKGQIQSGETITVIVIVSILLLIGLVFLGSFQSESQEADISVERELDEISRSIRLSQMAEFSCPERIARNMDNCVDVHKALAFKSLAQESDYRDFLLDKFGAVNISLSMVYPDNKSIELYSFEPEVISRQVTTFVPIVVYNFTDNSKGFGLLEVNILR